LNERLKTLHCRRTSWRVCPVKILWYSYRDYRQLFCLVRFCIKRERVRILSQTTKLIMILNLTNVRFY